MRKKIDELDKRILDAREDKRLKELRWGVAMAAGYVAVKDLKRQKKRKRGKK